MKLMKRLAALLMCLVLVAGLVPAAVFAQEQDITYVLAGSDFQNPDNDHDSGAAYVTSKAAVIGLTQHTALRFTGTGIRCNSVNPSTIVTPMTMHQDPAALNQDMFGQMRKHMNLSVSPCMPADVANILLFLASDESRALTGQVLVSDFGATL